MTAATEAELLAKVPDRLFIGGEWVASTSGRRSRCATRRPVP